MVMLRSRRRRTANFVCALAAAGATSVLVTMPATAAPRSAIVLASSDTTRGTALVERFFDLLQDGNVKGLKALLSSGFQLQGADGGYLDKQEFVADPPDVESYDLSNVKVTRAGDVLVVRYDVQAVVTIDGVSQSRDPAPRLSVFVHGKRGWQLVAHANFNVPAEEPAQ
jgi:hypothetical protein